MEADFQMLDDLKWLPLKDLSIKYNITETDIKKLLIDFNITRPSSGEIHKHRTEQKYLKKLEAFNLDEFIQYYKLYSRDDTIKYFNIDYGFFFFLINKFKLKKTKDELANSKKQTLIKNFGSFENYSREMVKKQRKTVFEKYGSEFYTQSEHYKENLQEYQEHSKKTCQQKYGCDNPFQAEEIIKKWDHKDASERAFNTKKKNGTVNTSKIQNWFVQQLIEIYGENDVFTEYNLDPRYPYHCDVYIKSIDTFIELNLFFTHGKHLFTQTSAEDIKKLEDWKNRAKTSNFYINAITVWTKLDPEKLLCAKNNNLNYITFYTEQEVKDYVKELKEKVEC